MARVVDQADATLTLFSAL